MKPTTWPAACRIEARPCRALAVGARDERAGEATIGFAHPIENRARALGAELHPEAADPGDVRERLGIGHALILAAFRNPFAPRGPSPPPEPSRPSVRIQP